MKTIILTAAIAAATAFSALAFDEELMIVTLKDGTNIEYNVENVDRVNFECRHTEEAFSVTPANGDTYAWWPTIPTMFREQPKEAGAATTFGFGTVEATTPEELTAGEYGLQISVSATKLYQGALDLATSKDSYVIKLVKYVDGGAEYVLDKVESGTLTTKINSKNQNVTIELDATFADGTTVTAKYIGKPAATESLAAMIPDINYGNEIFYYDTDGSEKNVKIVSVSKKYSSFSNKTTLTFTLDGYIKGDESLSVVLSDAIMNSEETEFNLAEVIGWEFYLESKLFHLCSSSGDENRDYYSRIIDNGKMRFVKNDDNTYKLYMEFTNSYTSMGNAGSTPEKFIFNYEGAFE